MPPLLNHEITNTNIEVLINHIIKKIVLINQSTYSKQLKIIKEKEYNDAKMKICTAPKLIHHNHHNPSIYIMNFILVSSHIFFYINIFSYVPGVLVVLVGGGEEETAGGGDGGDGPSGASGVG